MDGPHSGTSKVMHSEFYASFRWKLSQKEGSRSQDLGVSTGAWILRCVMGCIYGINKAQS